MNRITCYLFLALVAALTLALAPTLALANDKNEDDDGEKEDDGGDFGNPGGGDAGDGGDIPDNPDNGNGEGYTLVFDGDAPFESLTVEPGASDVLVNSFNCTIEKADCRIRGIDVTVTGSGIPSLDLLVVRIFHDIDKDGAIDVGEPLLGSGTPDGNGLLAYDFTLAGPPIQLAENETAFFTLACDVSWNVLDGRTFTFTASGVDAVPVGVPMGDVHAAGLENTKSGELLVSFGIEPGMTVTAIDFVDTTAEPGSPRIGVAGLRAMATGTTVTITSIELHAIGTLSDSVDISLVELFRDTNGNGLIDGVGEAGGDQKLAEGNWSGNNGSLSLPVGAAVPAGGEARLMVAMSINDTALPGKMAGLVIDGLITDPFTEPTGLPISSATITIIESETGGQGSDGSSSGGDDFDNPLTIDNSLAGCTAGTGGPASGLLALVVLLLHLAARRRG